MPIQTDPKQKLPQQTAPAGGGDDYVPSAGEQQVLSNWRAELARLQTQRHPSDEGKPAYPYGIEGLHPDPEWVRSTVERLAEREFRTGTPDEQLGSIEDLVQRNLGYTPGYWEDPHRIARWHRVIQALPQDAQIPDWLDVPSIEAAYKYLSFKNDNKPDTDWSWLHGDDVARSFMQGIPTPPADVMFPDELLYQPPPADQQPGPAGTMPAPGTPEWEQLETWERTAVSLFGSGSPLGGAGGGAG